MHGYLLHLPSTCRTLAALARCIGPVCVRTGSTTQMSALGFAIPRTRGYHRRMRAPALLLLLATACATEPQPDPNCLEAALKARNIESTLAKTRGELAELKELAQDVAQHMPVRGPETRACPPTNDAELTTALQRAATAERDLEEFKARAQEAKRAFTDPAASYDDLARAVKAL